MVEGIDIGIYLFLFLASCVSSFFGVTVGGGGLFLVPLLVSFGLPPALAIGTRRVQSVGMIPASLYRFAKGGAIDWKIASGIAITTIIGAYIGAKLLFIVPEQWMEWFIAILTIALVPYTFFQKNLGTEPHFVVSTLRRVLGYLLFGLVGFVGAFVGGGAQIFGSIILITCFGQTFLQSAGTRKLASLCLAITSLAVYIANDSIRWDIGIVLLLGGVVGGYAGSHIALKKGNAWVRWLFLVVTILLAINILL